MMAVDDAIPRKHVATLLSGDCIIWAEALTHQLCSNETRTLKRKRLRFSEEKNMGEHLRAYEETRKEENQKKRNEKKKGGK